MERRAFDRATEQRPPAGFLVLVMLVLGAIVALALSILWR
jgi:hypothetical protein